MGPGITILPSDGLSVQIPWCLILPIRKPKIADSYCINNPLKLVVPSGLDYVYVGGSGSTTPDWVIALISITADSLLGTCGVERFYYLPDCDPDYFPIKFYVCGASHATTGKID
jgi:hypothetical protein